MYRQPMGFNADNVYYMSLNINEGEDNQEDLYSEEAVARRGADMVSLIERMRRNPHVEAAAFSANALPFKEMAMNNQLKLFENDTLEYVANFREASPDIVRIFQYKSTNGVSSAQMEELMRKGELLLGYQKLFTSKGGLERFLRNPLKAA